MAFDAANITPTDEVLKQFGGAPSLQQDDKWFGEEPEAPADLPPDRVTLVPPKVEAAPDPVIPEIPAEPEVPAEEPSPEDEPPVVEAALDSNAVVPVVEDEPKKTRGFPWSELKELRAARTKLEQEQAVAVAQASERQRQLDEIRAAQDYQRQQQEAAQRAQNPGTPGVDRPYTAAEVAQLKQEDPILHAQLVSEWAAQRTQQQSEEIRIMRIEQHLRDQIDSFKQIKPDYEDAARYLEDRESKRAAALGWSKAKIDAHLNERRGMLVQASLESGRNVADIVYQLSVADGWTLPTVTPAAVAPAPAAAQPSAVDQIRASQARTAAERGSIGNVTGGNPPRKASITRAQFMQLTPAQIERLEMENKCDIDDLLVG